MLRIWRCIPPPKYDFLIRDDFTLAKEKLNCEDYKHIFKRVGQEWLWFGRLALTEKELNEKLQDKETRR